MKAISLLFLLAFSRPVQAAPGRQIAVRVYSLSKISSVTIEPANGGLPAGHRGETS